MEDEGGGEEEGGGRVDLKEPGEVEGGGGEEEGGGAVDLKEPREVEGAEGVKRVRCFDRSKNKIIIKLIHGKSERTKRRREGGGGS